MAPLGSQRRVAPSLAKGAAGAGLVVAACAACCAPVVTPLVIPPLLAVISVGGAGLAIGGLFGAALLAAGGAFGYLLIRRRRRRASLALAPIASGCGCADETACAAGDHCDLPAARVEPLRIGPD